MRILTLVILISFISSCSNAPEDTADSSNRVADEVVNSEAESAIRELMDQQVDSWNSGDIEGYMSAYWQNERLTFIGSRGLTYGWKLTLDNYKKAYPDQSAMGELDFSIMEMKPLGEDHFYTIGMWQLNREKDTLAGWFDLLWEKKAEGWRIISDHSS